MCGKFTQLASWREVVAFSTPLEIKPDDAVTTATPMRFAQVIKLNGAGKRESAAMRWGFADKNAAGPARPKHMHARAETIDTKPTFARSFREGRGILLVQSFNEGEDLANGRTKQWVFTPRDGHPLAVAVIFEEWVKDEERLSTFVMVTVPPNRLVARVTDRMPAILRPEDWPDWLGETGADLAAAKALLRTYEPAEDGSGGWDVAEQAKKPAKPPGSGEAGFL